MFLYIPIKSPGDIAMDGFQVAADRLFRLEQPFHPHSASCGADGPFLGPVRLLARRHGYFELRPIEELNRVMSKTFARPLDCSNLLPGLRAVASALNDNDLCRAMIATQFMRLPVLDGPQALRAVVAEALVKADADDPKHPRWPAGSPDGKGGQFRAKDGSPGIRGRQAGNKSVARLTPRQSARLDIMKRLESRAVRLRVESSLNAVPFVGEVGDAAMVVDLALAAAEEAGLQPDIDAAVHFASEAPHELEGLYASTKDEAFSSFREFKKEDLEKRFGPAGEGFDYHHIVEQAAATEIGADIIHRTSNIIRIPRLIHEAISGIYSKTDKELGSSLWNWLKGKPIEVHKAKGVEVLRRLNIIR
jgi:hypothetical protein